MEQCTLFVGCRSNFITFDKVDDDYDINNCNDNDDDNIDNCDDFDGKHSIYNKYGM
jgi:hypothetical protein